MRILPCSSMAVQRWEHDACCLPVMCGSHTGSLTHPRTPLPCASLLPEVFPLIIFIAKHKGSQASPMAGVAHCCWPVPCCRTVPADVCAAPEDAALTGAWELHLSGMNSNPLNVEGCTHSPPRFAEVLWVCLKASVVFLFPSTDFCLALEAVCKILEGLLLLFSLSGMSGSA